MTTLSIINPKTNRHILVGGTTYNQLLKEGLLNKTKEEIDEDKVLAEVDNDNIQETIQKLNKELPDDIQAVRGRGKFKGKIVTRELNTKRKITSLKEKADDDTLEDAIERMVLGDIANTKKTRFSKGFYLEVDDDDESSDDYSD